MTRDTSFANESVRRGLYRIHVRVAPEGTGFEQRFEYVVAGSPTEVDAWLTDNPDFVVVHRSNVNDADYPVIRTGEPVRVPDALRAVDFAEMRAGDRDGSLAEFWRKLES